MQIKSSECAGYHSFQRQDIAGESIGEDAFGSFEVFWHAGDDENQRGWYWQSCFPGCLPDSEANGPFETSADAFDNANDF